MRNLPIGQRSGLLLIACFAFLLSLLTSLPLGMQAHAQTGGSPLPRVGPHGKQIDWAHPLRVKPTAAPSGTNATLDSNTVPLLAPPSRAGAGAQPQANFPSTC